MVLKEMLIIRDPDAGREQQSRINRHFIKWVSRHYGKNLTSDMKLSASSHKNSDMAEQFAIFVGSAFSC